MVKSKKRSCCEILKSKLEMRINLGPAVFALLNESIILMELLFRAVINISHF